MMTTHRTYIIAEAGVNHDGVLADALRLVDAAADCGANCVKFQTFDADLLAAAHATKAPYQQRTTGHAESQRDMLRRLSLAKPDYFELMKHAADCNIDFLSTPFDRSSLSYLVDELGLKRIKIGSGDLTNAPLLLDAARAGVAIVLSTGMSTMDEVAEALSVIAFGYSGISEPPSRRAFAAVWDKPEMRMLLRDRVALLHCTTEYPAPAEETNLRALDTLRKTYGLETGYSDHTLGIDVAVAAVARGASIIEKHLTLDRSRRGPDHAASLDPDEFKRMVETIRIVERALGDGHKSPQPAEIKNMPIARKSIVAARSIAAGEVLSEDNLVCKRPGDGLSPFAFWDLQGQKAARSYEAEELIEQ
jgi:N-acetylneuraminate synthase